MVTLFQADALHHTTSQLALSNGLNFEICFENGHCVGISEVSFGTALGTTSLRSPHRPWWVEITTPEGVRLRDFTLLNQREPDGGYDLYFSMSAQANRSMEWMLHETRARLNTNDWNQQKHPASGALLTLQLRPVTRTIGGRVFEGFSYQYHYQSEEFPIYRLLDRGTWEVGGNCLNSEFWLRNGTTSSIRGFGSEEEFYSTEWYLPGIANPNIFQFNPFQTQFPGFTFNAGEEGNLLTWATEPRHLRSLFEKKRGSNEIEHWHEHCGDLTGDFSSAKMEVLFCPDSLGRVERANTYEEMRELVAQTLHDAVGMRRERVSTYGMIEEWELPDLQNYIEKAVPTLLDAGVQTVGFANFFANNMNVWGVSNMCCTVDYKIPDSIGEDAFGRFCRAIRAGGAQAQMWGNTAISSLSYIFDIDYGADRDLPAEHERLRTLPRENSIMEVLDAAREPFVRNASGAIEADHYTPVFCQLNLRDEVVRDYWLKCWNEVHQKFGLNGLFLDSSFNMSSDKFHYHYLSAGQEGSATIDQTHLLGYSRPAHEGAKRIESQFLAHLSLMVEMQRNGYGICGEDLSVFGTCRTGPALMTRLDNLFLWSDCLCDFDALALEEKGVSSEEIFFRGLSYRMMWMLHFDIARQALSFRQSQGWRGDMDTPNQWHLQLFGAFNEVEAEMLEREILPGECGVLYSGKNEQILWAFIDFDLELTSQTRIEDVLRKNSTTYTMGQAPIRKIPVRKHHIYRLQTI